MSLVKHQLSMSLYLLSLYMYNHLLYSNRKGKLILFYEWVIDLKWSGTVKDSDKKVKGTISIPNLSDENTIEEVDVCLSLQ